MLQTTAKYVTGRVRPVSNFMPSPLRPGSLATAAIHPNQSNSPRSACSCRTEYANTIAISTKVSFTPSWFRAARADSAVCPLSNRSRYALASSASKSESGVFSIRALNSGSFVWGSSVGKSRPLPQNVTPITGNWSAKRGSCPRGSGGFCGDTRIKHTHQVDPLLPLQDRIRLLSRGYPHT